MAPYPDTGGGRRQYPVVDLVVCHGDFLNADHEYVHKNKSVKGFGTYGDIMIRDRKMYVAPTPFALTEGTTGLMTLIVPDGTSADSRFALVGQLARIETDNLIVGYSFDFSTNELKGVLVPNPSAGDQHNFCAYRLKSQSQKAVTMISRTSILRAVEDMDEE